MGESAEGASDLGQRLVQDFANMAAVQQGMKNGGFRGPLPNPKSEGAVTNLDRNLAKYMGTPGPKGLTNRRGTRSQRG